MNGSNDDCPAEEQRTAPSQSSGNGDIFHDDAALRQAEQQAAARAQQLEAIFEAISDGLFVYDQDGHILRMNRAARDLLGLDDLPDYTALSLEERGTMITQRYVQGQSLPLTQWATSRVLSGEVLTDTTAVEFTVRNLRGQELRISLSGAPIRDQGENIVGAINIVRDVTDRWRLEQQTTQRLDEFLGIIAHELRTPLAGLIAFVQTLLVQTAQGKGPPLAAWQQQALEGLDQASARLSELTDDLLDIARLQARQLELHPQPTDLVRLAQRAVERQQIMTGRHTITLVSAVKRLVLSIDPRRIEQVLSNLISNAIKYSPEGGPIAVTINRDIQRAEAILSVRDHGIGIPAQQQVQVFQRFVQAENARAHGIEGAGLGLYLCRAIVEQHGGRIWLESVEGRGSTFFIALPVAFHLTRG
jgi:PAS domain S-box-containing protein